MKEKISSIETATLIANRANQEVKMAKMKAFIEFVDAYDAADKLVDTYISLENTAQRVGVDTFRESVLIKLYATNGTLDDHKVNRLLTLKEKRYFIKLVDQNQIYHQWCRPMNRAATMKARGLKEDAVLIRRVKPTDKRFQNKYFLNRGNIKTFLLKGRD